MSSFTMNLKYTFDPMLQRAAAHVQLSERGGSPGSVDAWATEATEAEAMKERCG